jgi:hypothetical protein
MRNRYGGELNRESGARPEQQPLLYGSKIRMPLEMQSHTLQL